MMPTLFAAQAAVDGCPGQALRPMPRAPSLILSAMRPAHDAATAVDTNSLGRIDRRFNHSDSAGDLCTQDGRSRGGRAAVRINRAATSNTAEWVAPALTQPESPNKTPKNARGGSLGLRCRIMALGQLSVRRSQE